MYITKEVEIWVDSEDLQGAFEESDAHQLMPLVASLELLHEEHHRGSIRTCSHPACYMARDALSTARRLAEEHGYEEASIAALHAYTAGLREAEERARGVIQLGTETSGWSPPPSMPDAAPMVRDALAKTGFYNGARTLRELRKQQFRE